MTQTANPKTQDLQPPFVLALDVGTSSTRALLFDATGTVVPPTTAPLLRDGGLRSVRGPLGRGELLRTGSAQRPLSPSGDGSERHVTARYCSPPPI